MTFNNVVFMRGVVVCSAVVIRGPRPGLSFRIRIPRDASIPLADAGGDNADYFEVVAYGRRFLRLAPALTEGRRVVLAGYGEGRYEVNARLVARYLALIEDEEGYGVEAHGNT